MKQSITLKQWQELSFFRQRKFQEVSKTGGLPTIGRMIEFLLEQDSGYFSIDTLPVNSPLDFEMGLIMVTDDKKTFRKPELADALWEAVKEELEEKQ